MDDILDRGAREALGETRRCTATNRAGQRCGRAAIPGGFVCSFHGGNAPQVRRAARQRLEVLLLPKALDAIHAALLRRDPCLVCGRADADHDPTVLRAAIAVLDRTGFHPTLAIANAATEPEDWAYYATDEELVLVNEIAERCIERQRRGEEPPDQRPVPRAPLALPPATVDSIDGVVVDEEPEG